MQEISYSAFKLLKKIAKNPLILGNRLEDRHCEFMECVYELSGQKLISLVNTSPSGTLIPETKLSISRKGIALLDDTKGTRRDKRWTRGLAIAAIIISLIALMLEFEDRGLLPFIDSAPKASTQLTQGQ